MILSDTHQPCNTKNLICLDGFQIESPKPMTRPQNVQKPTLNIQNPGKSTSIRLPAGITLTKLNDAAHNPDESVGKKTLDNQKQRESVMGIQDEEKQDHIHDHNVEGMNTSKSVRQDFYPPHGNVNTTSTLPNKTAHTEDVNAIDTVDETLQNVSTPLDRSKSRINSRLSLRRNDTSNVTLTKPPPPPPSFIQQNSSNAEEINLQTDEQQDSSNAEEINLDVQQILRSIKCDGKKNHVGYPHDMYGENFPTKLHALLQVKKIDNDCQLKRDNQTANLIDFKCKTKGCSAKLLIKNTNPGATLEADKSWNLLGCIRYHS